MAYPETVLTIADHIAAGLEVTSYCSTGKHMHVLDLQQLMGTYGPDRELDYYFAQQQKCPECGAVGGGMQIKIKATE